MVPGSGFDETLCGKRLTFYNESASIYRRDKNVVTSHFLSHQLLNIIVIVDHSTISVKIH